MTGLGRRTRSAKDIAWTGWPHLILLVVCFLLGAFGGLILASLGEPSAELRSYLSDYFDLAAQGNFGLSFFSVLWDCVRWPLAVFVFGFTALGVAVIPSLMLMRGFLLSYTTASFGVLFGSDGVAAAAVLFLVTVLLILPVLFILGCEGLRGACLRLPGASASSDGRCRPEIFLPAIGILAIAAALQWTVTPIMLSAVCARLFH